MVTQFVEVTLDAWVRGRNEKYEPHPLARYVDVLEVIIKFQLKSTV